MKKNYTHRDAMETSNDSCSCSVAFICSSTCLALKTRNGKRQYDSKRGDTHRWFTGSVPKTQVMSWIGLQKFVGISVQYSYATFLPPLLSDTVRIFLSTIYHSLSSNKQTNKQLNKRNQQSKKQTNNWTKEINWPCNADIGLMGGCAREWPVLGLLSDTCRS